MRRHLSYGASDHPTAGLVRPLTDVGASAIRAVSVAKPA